MTERAAPLRRILELEQARGCDDGAVIGGLDRYLGRQRHSPLAVALRRSLPGGNYAALSPQQRQRWAQQALTTLDGGTPRPRTPRPRPGGRAAPARPPSSPRVSLDSPVTALKGVSRAQAAKLARLGVNSVGDLLYHFPHRYADYSQVQPIARLAVGQEQTVIATVWTANESQISRRHRGTEAIVGDATGNMRVVWFNQTHIARQLVPGCRVALSGKVTVFRGQKVMESPEYEILGQGELIHTGRLVPVYPLTEGLHPRSLRRLIKGVIDSLADAVPESLPAEVLRRRHLPPLPVALRQMHYPNTMAEAEAARYRLAFEELLVLQLGVLGRRRRWREEGQAPPLHLPPAVREGFVASLPFPLTEAQRRSLAQITADIAQERPMSRLLQGEVGSGKTVVAAAALLAAVASGCQGAIMAPTEVLAEQHFRTLCQLLDGSRGEAELGCPYLPYLGRRVRMGLLTGGLAARTREETRQAIAQGNVDIVVGTHALIQEGVTFPRLGLVVVDEQHRFGVVQRAALRQKGQRPHLLVMTATPIPRTLALTVYGDLDISRLDEMPPGRRPVRTVLALPHQRQEAYEFVRQQLRQGRQAFVICPLVEESEAVAARAAVQEYQRLQEQVFPQFRLGLLHGRMASSEKEHTMRRFRDGDLDILVSTAVVEVGIDVPNATVMVVEGADRFGLAQLHQFRGRVGRGQHQSYCILLAENPSPEAQERLRLVAATQDGLALAEADLRLRGPGEYLGTRQSGLPDLRVARLSDIEIMEQAREEASRLLEEDPDLSRYESLAARVKPLWQQTLSEAG